MKKVVKFLAVVLALTLIIGTIPAAAATNLSLTKTSKTIFVGGCKGSKANGKKANFYGVVSVAKFVKNFDSKKMDIKLTTSDKSVCTVNNSKDRITAKGMGTANVTVKVVDKATQKSLMSKTMKITVKKNASKASFKVDGIEDGDEFKAGTTIKVDMPRNGLDTDMRGLSCKTYGVTMKRDNTTGTTWTVTFDKAGTYDIKAYAYQSETYQGATMSKDITVTVTESDEKKPEATPTPVPTEEPKATEAPKPTETPLGQGTIAQTTLDSFTLTFAETPVKAEKADFQVYTKVANSDVKINYSSINEVKIADKSITVSMLSSFTGGVDYFVDFKGQTYSFKAASSDVKSITTMEIVTKEVLVKTVSPIEIKYYNSIGIDITKAVKDFVIPVVSCETATTDSFATGTNVYIQTVGKPYTFKASITVEGKTITATQAISAYEPKYSGCIWTIAPDDGIYMKKDDARVNYFTKDDTNATLEVLFTYTDGSVKTIAEVGISKVYIANETIFMKASDALSGGYKLIANNTGKSAVIFYDLQGNPLDSIEIEVKPERTPAKIALTANKNVLNVNSAVGDSIKLSAKVYDQYDAEMKDQLITIEQTDATKTITGNVVFAPFVSGETIIAGSSVGLNTGVTNGVIQAIVKCGNVSQTYGFTVGNYDKATLWTLTVDTTDAALLLNSTVKPGNNPAPKYTFGVQGIVPGNGSQFTVTKENLVFFPGKMPNAQLKSADLGVADGTTIYLVTVQKDGSYLSVLPAQIKLSATDLQFCAFTTAAEGKLASGKYIVTAYAVKAGTPFSEVNPIGVKEITVYDEQTPVTYKKDKDKTVFTSAVDIVRDCYTFFYAGTAIDDTAIIDAEMTTTTSATSYFLQKAYVLFNNVEFGDYRQVVDISDTVSK